MYLGIDLGTSNSAIVGNDGGTLKLFKTAEGTDVLPSVLYVDRGRRFVGKRAYDNAPLAPNKAVQRFKRLMGTSTTYELAGADAVVTPEEASAEVLRTLLGQVRTEAGDKAVEGTIVTIPAAFNQMQSQATLRAAEAAGLDRVGLLQEPIAAAMAAIAQSKNTDGQFLIYDFGGGTFDLALVQSLQSLKGVVNIIAHEGINMLGGTDFDRAIVDSIVRPWLLENFDLPENFQRHPQYAYLIPLAQRAAEEAKIRLSTKDSDIIFAADEHLRTRDRSGADIYLDIAITRADLEALIAEKIDETIHLCRKIIKDNGYSNDQIGRLVLIGGPSKMPYIREHVSRELGIPADLDQDPMTAVAVGAAIYAESRDWSGETTRRKSSRGTAQSSGPVSVRYDYAQRTSDDRVRLRIVPERSVAGEGYRVLVEALDGWKSGQVDLAGETSLELTLKDVGENRFRITVFGSDGAPASPQTEITVFRTHASAGGTPATKTIAVKVVVRNGENEWNELEPLVEKGTTLPAEGTKRFRAARDLRANQAETLDFELYEQAPGVKDPELNLFVGFFRVSGIDHLEAGDHVRKGMQIDIHWKMDDNGLLSCTLEMADIAKVFDTGKYYTDVAGHQNFSDRDVEAFASSMLDTADRELDDADETLNDQGRAEVAMLRRRAERQREALERAADADTRRSVTEEARAIRQATARLRDAPENQERVLQQELDQLVAGFDDHGLRANAPPDLARQFDGLAEVVRRSIAGKDFDRAKQSLRQMRGLAQQVMYTMPSYIIHLFKTLADEAFLSVDKALHGRLVARGERCVADNDMTGLRRVIGEMFDNRFQAAGADARVSLMADLARA